MLVASVGMWARAAAALVVRVVRLVPLCWRQRRVILEDPQTVVEKGGRFLPLSPGAFMAGGIVLSIALLAGLNLASERMPWLPPVPADREAANLAQQVTELTGRLRDIDAEAARVSRAIGANDRDMALHLQEQALLTERRLVEGYLTVTTNQLWSARLHQKYRRDLVSFSFLLLGTGVLSALLVGAALFGRFLRALELRSPMVRYAFRAYLNYCTASLLLPCAVAGAVMLALPMAARYGAWQERALDGSILVWIVATGAWLALTMRRAGRALSSLFSFVERVGSPGLPSDHHLVLGKMQLAQAFAALVVSGVAVLLGWLYLVKA